MSFDVKTRLSMLRGSARKRGLNVNLDLNKYQALIDLGCTYCGKDLSNENGYCLDRLDSSKGYNLFNVVGCCKICNRAKSDMTVEAFIDMATRVSNHYQMMTKIFQELNKEGIYYSPEMELDYYNNLENKNLGRLKMVNSINIG